MITLKYCIKGQKNSTRTREFPMEQELQLFTSNASIIVLEVERSGKAMAGRLNKLFGC